MKRSPQKNIKGLLRKSPARPIRKLHAKQLIFQTIQVDFILQYTSKPQSVTKIIMDSCKDLFPAITFAIDKPQGALKDLVSNANYSCMVHTLAPTEKDSSRVFDLFPQQLSSKDGTKKCIVSKKTILCTFPVPVYVEWEKDNLVSNVDLSNQLYGLLEQKLIPFSDWCKANKTFILSSTPTPTPSDKPWIAYKGSIDIVRTKQQTPVFLQTLQRFTERVIEIGGIPVYETLAKAFGVWKNNE